MRLIIILAVCLALFSAGCMQKENRGGDSEKESSAVAAGAGSPEKITVTINSPAAGQIIKGDEEISFDGSAEGGKGDLSYEWSSSIDGRLSSSRSFKQNPAELEKGGHIIILKVTDESGNIGQGSVRIEVM